MNNVGFYKQWNIHNSLIQPENPESFPYGEVEILIDPGVGRLDRKVAGITFETWSQNDDWSNKQKTDEDVIKMFDIQRL
jgi:photosystem II stability/assembly factor-like uncharacterized protein